MSDKPARFASWTAASCRSPSYGDQAARREDRDGDRYDAPGARLAEAAGID